MSNTSNSNTNIVLTPIMNIKYLQVAKPQGRTNPKNKQPILGKDGQQIKDFIFKGEVDGSTPEGKEFRDLIEGINDKRIGTKGVSSPEHFTVNFTSQFDVEVTDNEGTLLEGTQIPFFDSRVDTGSARAAIAVINNYGTTYIRLKAVQLVSLDLTEKEFTKDSGDSSGSLIEKLDRLSS